MARYLAENANDYAINTLKQRLAALAHWHHERGFVDPTRTAYVRKVLKGIQTLHRAASKNKPGRCSSLYWRRSRNGYAHAPLDDASERLRLVMFKSPDDGELVIPDGPIIE